MGSKEPPGYFCEAFSYIRFLFFRGSNYSIKTNRQPAIRRSLRANRDAGCVELMSSRTNGITSLLVTCNLFEKRWRCLLWCATFLSRSFRAFREWQSYTTGFHNHSRYRWMQSDKRSILSCHIQWWKRQEVCIKLFEQRGIIWREKKKLILPGRIIKVS